MTVYRRSSRADILELPKNGSRPPLFFFLSFTFFSILFAKNPAPDLPKEEGLYLETIFWNQKKENIFGTVLQLLPNRPEINLFL